MAKKSFLNKFHSHYLTQEVIEEWCKLDPDNYFARRLAVIAACDAGKIEYFPDDHFPAEQFYADECNKHASFVDFLMSYGQLNVNKVSFDAWVAEVEGQGDTGCESFCDPHHPFHAGELKIAIDSWRELYEANPPDRVPKGGHKKYIEDHLKSKYPDLGSNARNRIATIINPNHRGGASPTSSSW